MVLIKGSHLVSNQRKLVLSAFVHRFTGEHKPEWANKPRPDGTPYEPMFSTDEEWINAYAFWFKKDGTLSEKPGYCVPMSLYEVERGIGLRP